MKWIAIILAALLAPVEFAQSVPVDYVAMFASRDPGANDKYAGNSDSGIMAWSESYLLQSYVMMYRTTHDAKYIAEADADIQKDMASAAAHGWQWTTTTYSINHAPYAYTVHDGMILAPIADFVSVVESDPALVSFKPHADADLAAMVAHFAHKWDAQYCEVNGHGFFKLPTWDTQYAGLHPGISLPFNQSEAFARFLYKLSKLTGDATYREKATAIAVTLKSYLHGKGAGVYWNYAADILSTDGTRYMPVSDSSHANIDLLFVADLVKDGVVFSTADQARMAATFTYFTYDAPTKTLHQYMDGSGALNVSGFGSNLSGWATLPAAHADVLAVLQNPKSGVGGSTYELAVANLAASP